MAKSKKSKNKIPHGFYGLALDKKKPSLFQPFMSGCEYAIESATDGVFFRYVNGERKSASGGEEFFIDHIKSGSWKRFARSPFKRNK